MITGAAKECQSKIFLRKLNISQFLKVYTKKTTCKIVSKDNFGKEIKFFVSVIFFEVFSPPDNNNRLQKDIFKIKFGLKKFYLFAPYILG